jgi:nucleotide-binding universal stress UspA family protein
MTISQFRFKTILVATDLSDSSSCALRYARKIAQLHGSTLIILYAIDPAGYAFPKGMPDFAASDQSAREVLKIRRGDSAAGYPGSFCCGKWRRL